MSDTKTLPAPIRQDSRTCFGINWYATEEEADQVAEAVRARGETYNGGFLHGTPCGRDKTWDVVKDGVVVEFAVTIA